MHGLFGSLVASVLVWVIVLTPFGALADELRQDGNAYFIDKNDDDTRATDGSEPTLDFHVVNVPGDYSSVQAALDSDDCGAGTLNANDGCRIVVANGTYAESFEIGATDAQSSTLRQNSIIIEGVSPAGSETAGGVQMCAVTFTGDNTTDNTVIRVNHAQGVILRNFCIDMDENTNDSKYGVEIGYDVGTTRFVGMKNVRIEDTTTSGGVAIRIGNGASSDAPFVRLESVSAGNVPTCIEVDSEQAVHLISETFECQNPTGTIGGVSVTAAGGEISLQNFFMGAGAADQIGINVHNLAIGTLNITNPTFEWDQTDGTLINLDDDGSNPSTGGYRAINIFGGRFRMQSAVSVARNCINMSRNGTLNVIGVSFESSDATHTCSFAFDNPHGTRETDVYWLGNDIAWVNDQASPSVTRTTTGGPMRVLALENGEVIKCSGAGTGLTSGSTGCDAPAYQNDLAGVSAASSTDNAIPRFDGTTGDLQDSGLTISDTNELSLPGALTMGGYINLGGFGILGAGVVNIDAHPTDGGVFGTKEGTDDAPSGAGSEQTLGHKIPDTGLNASKIHTVDADGLYDGSDHLQDDSITAAKLGAGAVRDTASSAPVDGSTPCDTGDIILDTTNFKVYFCTDGATEKWYGAALSDTP